MSGAAHFSPVTTQKASGAIYDQIREMILSRELKPGDKLPSERVLMQMMQRSRPTIREALRMLENAGLIQIIPGGGAVVQEPSVVSVRQPLEHIMALQAVSDAELYEYRSYIEEAIAGWAAQRRTEADLEALWKCIEDSRAQIDDFDVFLKLDVQFRILVAEASHNRLAVIMENVIHSMVIDMLSKALAVKSMEQRHTLNIDIIKDNERIYEAIEKRNSELARKEIRRQTILFLEDSKLDHLLEEQ